MDNVVKNIWQKIVQPGRTWIIAEAGVNHNGDIRIAKRLIDAAKMCGADAVKFQAFTTKNVVTKNAKKSDYQLKTTKKTETLYDLLAKLELTYDDFSELAIYARRRGIIFMASTSECAWVDKLCALDVPLLKIASSDITNLPLIDYLAKKKKPMILSTGRSTLPEVKEAVAVIEKNKNKRYAILHCVSVYPADFATLNLRAMLTLKRAFGCPVGFSDHSVGIEAAVAAVAMGAQIIEKHLTINRRMPGPDHLSSADPKELSLLIASIRNIEHALGTGKKTPDMTEMDGRVKIRKGLVAGIDIPRGTKIGAQMISIKRPCEGIEPKYFSKVIGKVAKETITQDAPITWDKVGSVK